MKAPACSGFERSLSAQKAGMLKMATDQRCECCGDRIAPGLLQIHCIPGMIDGNPVSSILILCPVCHTSMHTLSVPGRDQRLLVRSRSAEREGRIRRVFREKPYHPPPSPDPEELFASALSAGGMDLFLNGA